MRPTHHDDEGHSGPRGPHFGGARHHEHGGPRAHHGDAGGSGSGSDFGFGFGGGFAGPGAGPDGPGSDGPSEHRRGHGGPGFGFGGPGPGFAPGFGFGREGRRARRGDVRLAILGLLRDAERAQDTASAGDDTAATAGTVAGAEPMNGYGIIKAIAERTGGAWKPSPGSVYPTLQQLVDEGLVQASGVDGRSVYQLTDAGRAEVEARTEDITRAWDTAPGTTDAQQGLGESLQKLFGVLHLFRTTATDAQRAAAAEKLDQLRRDLLQILAD